MAKSSRNKRKKQKKHVPAGPTMAEQADLHVLYQESVQCSESEIDFIDETFEKMRGRKARLLREDFCGTAMTSCEWVKRRPGNRAIGVDLDESVLDWGKEHNLGQLSADELKCITLINDDVTKVKTDPVEIVLAMNFSYWCFKDRPAMRKYFEQVRNALQDDGILLMDSYGGYEANQELEEEREQEGFDYVWEQAKYDPITGDTVCHIHFNFPDGSSIKKAFTYDWRLWTLPEIRELLLEAGFSKVTIYWDMADDEDEDDYQPAEHGEADAGFVAYIAAEK